MNRIRGFRLCSALVSAAVLAFGCGAQAAELPLKRVSIKRNDMGVLPTQLGTAVNGVLTLTTRSRRPIFYEITAPSDEDRQIVIEEARADGWKPSDTPGVEETPTRFRYTVTAPRGQVTRAMLVLERADSRIVTLTALAPDDMLAWIRGLQNEGEAVKDAVARLGAIVNDINKARTQRTQLEAESKKIVDDQDRIRQNLQTVGQGSDLGRRYLDTLKSQEDRLAEINRIDARWRMKSRPDGGLQRSWRNISRYRLAARCRGSAQMGKKMYPRVISAFSTRYACG